MEEKEGADVSERLQMNSEMAENELAGAEERVGADVSELLQTNSEVVENEWLRRRSSRKTSRERGEAVSTLCSAAAAIGDVNREDHIVDQDEDEEAEGMVLDARLPWDSTDCEHNYDELLSRVFKILLEKKPELVGERRPKIMRPPQILREGTKKTVYASFMDDCNAMHRTYEHVMAFFLAEMGTSGSLDGQQRLVVRGRFAPKNSEGILRRYINQYVTCSACKRPDTILIDSFNVNYVGAPDRLNKSSLVSLLKLNAGGSLLRVLSRKDRVHLAARLVL